MHQPMFYENEGADTLVLFVHGFMGSPNQFEYYANHLRAHNVAVAAVLLPGHGGSSASFSKHALNSWQEHLQTQLEHYAQRYSNIVLVGHSMGGLLALNASTNRANKVSGVFGIATPAKVHLFSPKAIWNKIKLVFYPKHHIIKQAYLQANSVQIGIGFLFGCLRPVRGLYQLIQTARNNLAQVTVPVVLVHSRCDETVPHKSGSILSAGLCNTSCKTILINNALHAYYPADEREQILCEIMQLIQTVTGVV